MTKDKYLRVRISTGQLAHIERLAAELGVAKSEVVREVLDRATLTGRPRLAITDQT